MKTYVCPECGKPKAEEQGCLCDDCTTIYIEDRFRQRATQTADRVRDFCDRVRNLAR